MVQGTSVSLSPDPSITSYLSVTETNTVTVTKFRTIAEFAPPRNYILAGGQNGSWFTPSQYPRLEQIFSDSNSSKNLNTVKGKGAVWSGATNGFQFLLSGWGAGNMGGPSNPYLYIFNGTSALNDTLEDSAEAEWAGGDIFAISTNGTGWLVSGMGSGVLNAHAVRPARGGATGSSATNHLSLGYFDGTKFTDYSSSLPEQMDGILYANAFNGSTWLVGGGYLSRGVLLLFDGKKIMDLTATIRAAVASFSSVQSIAWNGRYWMIGGIGFLATFDGIHFFDLTRNLVETLNPSVANNGLQSVNTLEWNGTTWLLGGGEPIALNALSSAPWLASYNSSTFDDLSSRLPSYITNSSSSILTISPSNYGSYWMVGGYSRINHGMLLKYQGDEIVDMSNMAGDMSYVNWVEAP